MKLSELKINPNNPQTFDDISKLEDSIRNFPKMMKLRPMVYDPVLKVVLGGNKRLVCLQNMGYKEIPDDWAISADDLTEEEKKRFVIADNVGFGTWDIEMLQNDYDSEELKEWGLEIETDINDVDVITDFNESVNFSIKCDNLEQLEELQTKLSCSSQKISYQDFLIKVGL